MEYEQESPLIGKSSKVTESLLHKYQNAELPGNYFDRMQYFWVWVFPKYFT